MSQQFQKNIQSWVNIDNKIKNLKEDLKNLRSNKNQLTNSIFTYLAIKLVL